MPARVLHIDSSLDGASLGQAIKQLLRDRSWSEVKRLIANRHVQVHGNLCLDDARRVQTGDVVKVFEQPLDKPPAADDLAIVYRDAHVAIVEKPAGVTTQREPREQSHGRAQRQATLDELLQQAIDRLGPVRDVARPHAASPQKPDDGFIFRRRVPEREARQQASSKPARQIVRPVHRLDRDTSGLMVFALSPAAESKLVAIFKTHAVERVYRAVVIGHVERAMTIASDLTRDRGDGLRGSTTDPKAGDKQHAITHVKPIETIGDYTMIECRLQTGRTHQIRIHLAERGHMLCGEKTYTKPLGGKPFKEASNAPRHALHATRIAFAHPITGERITRESDWPRDLARWLERLRSAHS